MFDVPRELAQYLSRLLHGQRRRHGSRRRGTRTNSRALTCFRQAVLGLRWFRQNVEVTAVARDHGISRTTGYRYLDEVIDVLADQAPDLHQALQKAKADGLAYAILNEKIFPADRCSEKTLNAKRETYRSVVLRESPRARRQHPSRHGTRRVPPVGGRRRAWLDA
jgi:hypothetical protein